MFMTRNFFIKLTLKGNVCNTIGTLPKIGNNAPDFKSVDKNLKENSLGDFFIKKIDRGSNKFRHGCMFNI